MSFFEVLFTLIALASFLILVFILMCKFIDLFAKRTTDAMPFLMGKNWMILAIVTSAIFILAILYNTFCKLHTVIKQKDHKLQNFFCYLIVIGLVSALPVSIIVMFSLFLSNKIPYERVAYFTKVISYITVVSFVMLSVMIIFCLGAWSGYKVGTLETKKKKSVEEAVTNNSTDEVYVDNFMQNIEFTDLDKKDNIPRSEINANEKDNIPQIKINTNEKDSIPQNFSLKAVNKEKETHPSGEIPSNTLDSNVLINLAVHLSPKE